MKTVAKPRAHDSLGIALLTYLLLIIVVVTLLPFRFQWPPHLQIILVEEFIGVVANFCLFLPLGFVYRLNRRQPGDPWCGRPVVFGVAISMGIEVVQLFMPGRYTSPTDILANAVGVWAGAMLHAQVTRRLHERLVDQLALEMPLMHLFYLLVPLLWLNSLTVGDELSRLWLLPLLGLCGAMVLAAVWTRRLQPTGALASSALAWVIALWFWGGVLPGFVRWPGWLALCGVGLALAARCMVALPWSMHEDERRFEVLTLRRIWPLYIAYVILMALWPWPWLPGPWQASIGFAEVADIPGVIPTLRVVAYIAAFTLFGYMVAESRGRQHEPLLNALRGLLVYSAFVAGGLECLRGFHPDHIASLAHFAVATAAALYGGAIYRLQLVGVRQLLAHHAE
ncbi:MAG: VanZ family protein [Candidatus Tectomicrobia bacterium]